MARPPLTVRGPAVPLAMPLRSPDTGGAGMPGERHLVAAIERVVRAPHGWSAVALHLSRLAAPGPRPHHRRVAHAVMQESAERNEGQMFALRNGDVVLLYRDTRAAAAAVPEMLRSLFGREVEDPRAVVSEWRLPHAGAPLLAYTAERIAGLDAPGAEANAAPPAAIVDALARAIGTARPHDLIRRQTAVLLETAAGGIGSPMRPLYRELSLSLNALEAGIAAPAPVANDPALLLHLGRRFDQWMLDVLRLGRGGQGSLDFDWADCDNAASTVHLNLSLRGVLSDDFSAFAESVRAGDTALGVEIALVEAVADPGAFVHAAARLRRAGALVVLDGISHLALLMVRPQALGADLIKLEWSSGIAGLRAEDRQELARTIRAADPARLILDRADSEAAVRWGQAQGVRRFQGQHIDQMLAAQRMLACEGAPACTLRQCVERAGATGNPGRAGCTNLELLDAGLPLAGGNRAGR